MIPELLERFPEGSDITIMNCFYQYPIFENSNKICDDMVCIVYKDNKTNIKDYIIINKPTYTFYKLKEGLPIPDYNHLFMKRENLDPVTVPFASLERSIADLVGKRAEYDKNVAARNKAENKKFHTDTRIFNSDSNIEDHYRFKFAQLYTNNINKINKSFFDIEVDGKWAVGDFVEMGECAINCVSFFDEKSDTSFTFILRDSRNPLIQQFENEVSSGNFGYNEIHNFITDKVGGLNLKKKYGLLESKFKLLFFDSEIDLITSLFRTIHKCSPDFVEGWNSSGFDLEYIIARIGTLGYDPADIMCDPRWKVKIVKNYVDSRNKNELAERGDYTFISGLPVFIDQMIQYASRRKSKIGSFKSFKLDDIGLLEAGVQKLDYHHITSSVTELPWLDFKTFVLYNIMDVIVQKCIEAKTNDLEYLFSKAIVNNTSYKKAHRQTVYLINRMTADWYKMGYVIGNNINKWNEKPPKFLGALVGDPTHTDDFSKMKIDGRPIWLCDNLQDYDYKSLYPSIMIEFNIAPNTQYGRIVIPEKVYEHENVYHVNDNEFQYSRSGEFIENMVTDNVIEYCKRWFHLAGFKEFLEDIDEYYSGYGFKSYSNLENAFTISPLEPVSDNVVSVVTFNGNEIESPVYFVNERAKELNYDSLMKGLKSK